MTLSMGNAISSQMQRPQCRSLRLQAGTNMAYFETFKVANKTLEAISSDLEDFLSMKRMAFPRFYFLSNDELLEILAQTKNVHAVQPHIQKCFDGIKRLEFSSQPGSVNITAMLSAEGEVRIACESLSRTLPRMRLGS
jgi:dynein heavy chain, axonemal